MKFKLKWKRNKIPKREIVGIKGKLGRGHSQDYGAKLRSGRLAAWLLTPA
jgi:hypothetical protein